MQILIALCIMASFDLFYKVFFPPPSDYLNWIPRIFKKAPQEFSRIYFTYLLFKADKGIYFSMKFMFLKEIWMITKLIWKCLLQTKRG